MQKYFYLLLLVFLLWNFAFAQTFSIGIRNGVVHTGITGRFDYRTYDGAQLTYNTIKVYGDKDKPWNISKFKKNSSGYLKPVFGFCINYRFNKNTSLQSEFNYMEKGFDFRYMLFDESLNGYYKTQYLSIPVSLTYEIGKSVKYYGYIGTSVNRLLMVRNYTSHGFTYFDPNGLPYDIMYDESYRPTEFNKKDLSALIGTGIKIPLFGKANFIIDMRYDIGITRAAKNTDYSIYFMPNPNHADIPNNFQNVFNRSVSLCWGILWNIGRKKDIQTKQSR